MDNKTLLAIVLSIGVILGYQLLFPQHPQQVTPAKTSAPAPVKEEATSARAVAATPQATPPAQEKEVRVENNLFTAVLSSRGATVKYWEIKGYKDNKGHDVVLLGKPSPLPALAIGSDTGFGLADADFIVSGGDLKLDGSGKSGSVVFEYSRDGQSVRRTYTFYSDSYKVDLTDEVSGFPSYWITLGSDFGIFDKEAGRYAFVGPALLKGTDLKELKDKDLKTPQTYKEGLKWIALEDKYFCSALVPVGTVAEARAWMYKDAPVIAFEGKPGVNKFFLYAGPKDHDSLARLGLGLQYIVDFGFFSIIAEPLFWILKFFHSFVGNYGWSIILLTIVARIPFIPLVTKGQKSMRKLQQIQPKMNEIREKYKKDPQKMQQEMMELYKKNKVNPMGGCLPMVIQIPVFFALYKVLLVSIELRSAPFMLWITDLSAPDTLLGHMPSWLPLLGGMSLGVLPIAMGLTMFIQQKMTPSGMDPKQAKMMLLMPFALTLMFMNLASGLVLYMFVSNLLSIAQQFYINRKLAKQETA